MNCFFFLGVIASLVSCLAGSFSTSYDGRYCSLHDEKKCQRLYGTSCYMVVHRGHGFGHHFVATPECNCRQKRQCPLNGRGRHLKNNDPPAIIFTPIRLESCSDDEAKVKNCQNGGVCKVLRRNQQSLQHSFSCFCAKGYYGRLCEQTNPSKVSIEVAVTMATTTTSVVPTLTTSKSDGSNIIGTSATLASSSKPVTSALLGTDQLKLVSTSSSVIVATAPKPTTRKIESVLPAANRQGQRDTGITFGSKNTVGASTMVTVTKTRLEGTPNGAFPGRMASLASQTVAPVVTPPQNDSSKGNKLSVKSSDAISDTIISDSKLSPLIQSEGFMNAVDSQGAKKVKTGVTKMAVMPFEAGEGSGDENY